MGIEIPHNKSEVYSYNISNYVKYYKTNQINPLLDQTEQIASNIP